jgi:hypothetical protein
MVLRETKSDFKNVNPELRVPPGFSTNPERGSDIQRHALFSNSSSEVTVNRHRLLFLAISLDRHSHEQPHGNQLLSNVQCIVQCRNRGDAHRNSGQGRIFYGMVRGMHRKINLQSSDESG